MDAAIVEAGIHALSLFLIPDGRRVAAYFPMPDEAEITALLLEFLEHDVPLAFPRLGPGGELSLHEVRDFHADLVTGAYGILEPRRDLPELSPQSISLFFVPGRLFSRQGHRIGRGRGCYDRLLARASGRRVAFPYACQIREAIPVEPHDERIDLIITPDEVLETRREVR